MEFFVLTRWPDPRRCPAATNFLEAEPCYMGKAPRCPGCGRMLVAHPWLAPYRAELEVWGRQFGDLAFGLGPDLLVSQRLKSFYEEDGLRGLEGFNQVDIVGIRRHRQFLGVPPTYYRVRVTPSLAAIDRGRSELEAEGPVRCALCLDAGLVKRARHVVVDPASWSGEDLFLARGLPGLTLTSARFRDFCAQRGINNAMLVPAEDYAFDYYPWER